MSVKKIAEQAGVSVATVSRVLHRSEQVTPHTRELVEKAMQRLGYTAKDLARGARGQCTLIGLVVPDLRETFFCQMAAGVQRAAAQAGMSVFVCDLGGDDARAPRYLELLTQAGVQGVVLAPAGADDASVTAEALQRLGEQDVCVVLADREAARTALDSVSIDNTAGAYAATKLLLDAGRRNIAIIAGPDGTKRGREQLDGYCAAHADAGAALNRGLIFYSDYTVQGGREQAQAVFAEHPETDALFLTDDSITLGALEALHASGRRVPQDVAVVGVDGAGVLPALGLSITVLERPGEEMGRYAVELLQRAIVRRRNAPPTQVTLMPELCVRGSE